jgi:hypothetical protein
MFSLNAQDRKPVIPALICAVASAVMLHTNILSFLFLSPLGIASSYGAVFAWLAFAAATVANGFFSLGVRLYYGASMEGFGIDVLYFMVLSLAFTWIMGWQGGALKMRTAYRFIISAAVVSLAILLVTLTSSGSAFADMARTQSEAVSAVIISSAGADTVRRSLLENTVSPEAVYQIIKALALRGGAVFSAVFLFFINRQASKAALAILRKQKYRNELPSFHVPLNFIWILSISLAAIVLSGLLKMEMPGILAWNVLVICVILFLGQGTGIALFNFQKRALSTGPRLLICALVFFAVITPVINVVVFGALVLLGIAENWLPLRTPKKDGPASTPEP